MKKRRKQKTPRRNQKMPSWAAKKAMKARKLLSNEERAKNALPCGVWETKRRRKQKLRESLNQWNTWAARRSSVINEEAFANRREMTREISEKMREGVCGLRRRRESAIVELIWLNEENQSKKWKCMKQLSIRMKRRKISVDYYSVCQYILFHPVCRNAEAMSKR